MTDKRISAAERRWLLRELESWRNDSFISAEQAEKILTGYESKDELQARSRSRLVFVLFSMAALLFGLAVLLLIGFNWEAIPRGLKLFLCVGGLAAVQGLGLYLLHATRHRRAAEVLCFFGCLTFGAAIWLVAQALAVSNLKRNRSGEKVGYEETSLGRSHRRKLRTFLLGMESQRWPVILRWKSVIA